MSYIPFLLLIASFLTHAAEIKHSDISPKFGGVVAEATLEEDHNKMKSDHHIDTILYAELTKTSGNKGIIYFFNRDGSLVEPNKLPSHIRGTIPSLKGRGTDVSVKKSEKNYLVELSSNPSTLVLEFGYKGLPYHIEFRNLDRR